MYSWSPFPQERGLADLAQIKAKAPVLYTSKHLTGFARISGVNFFYPQNPEKSPPYPMMRLGSQFGLIAF